LQTDQARRFDEVTNAGHAMPYVFEEITRRDLEVKELVYG
jgi:hypothetical protein